MTVQIRGAVRARVSDKAVVGWACAMDPAVGLRKGEKARGVQEGRGSRSAMFSSAGVS